MESNGLIDESTKHDKSQSNINMVKVGNKGESFRNGGMVETTRIRKSQVYYNNRESNGNTNKRL